MRMAKGGEYEGPVQVMTKGRNLKKKGKKMVGKEQMGPSGRPIAMRKEKVLLPPNRGEVLIWRVGRGSMENTYDRP